MTERLANPLSDVSAQTRDQLPPNALRNVDALLYRHDLPRGRVVLIIVVPWNDMRDLEGREVLRMVRGPGLRLTGARR